MGTRKRESPSRLVGILSVTALLILSFAILPVWAKPVEKDIADHDENTYLYGADADEVLIFTSTATGDVNGDGLDDLIMGHDQGGTAFPYLYTGKVYVYYGRTSIPTDVDLGSGADVIINGYWASFSGNSVATGDVNGDNIDDIIIGAWMDTPTPGATYAGGVAVIFGRTDLETESPWDFNVKDPDLYMSSNNGGEYCGMSVASGDIDGDGYDDVLYGAPLGNGGVHFGDGTNWSTEGGANQDSLRDISMIDTSSGWAVGQYLSNYDTLYYYDGTSWDKDVWLDTFKVDFNGVSCVDANHVWAVGESGTIAFYNGTDWAAQTSGVGRELRDVVALDANTAWAVGDSGTILKTTDGGTTWNPQTSNTTADLMGISATDANTAWVVGDSGTIVNTTDGGTTWTPQSVTTRTLRSVSAVVGTTAAWAVGNAGVIYRTTDGTNWSQQVSNTSEILRGVSALNANTCYAVGDAGTILKTADGGTNWSQDTVLFSQRLNGVDVLDATHVWTVGEAAAGRAYIVWGRNNTLWQALSWSHANPIAPNKVINGVDAFDYCGVPVSTGNLDGDSREDMVIGAYEADGPGNARNGCGEAYAVYGRTKGAFPYFIDLAFDSNCTVYGGTEMDGLPSSVCNPLKDINNDRYDDLIFGVTAGDGPDDDKAGCGEIDVIYGGNLPAKVDLAVTDPDVMVFGNQEGLGIGFSVGAFDFNADGMNDLATGSPSASKSLQRPNCGAVWMVNGMETWPSRVDLGTSADMVVYGAEENDSFGNCISSANLNGDPTGYQDMVLSDASGDGPGNTRPDCGEHFIFLGYDNIPPTCTIDNVVEGAVVSGTVNVQVTAQDYHGIDRVEFLVNGEVQATDYTPPYEWDWDTRGMIDGTSPTLAARAFDVNGNSATDQRGVTVNNSIPKVSTTWYLAEGTTAWGFEEWVLIQNPNPVAVDVTVTFMKPGGLIQVENYAIAASSRFTINVNSIVAESDVSTKVEGSLPIICERAMYWNDRGGGHDSIGVINPSTTWYLAEGTTAWDFETYVLVQNPNTDPTGVKFTFMLPGGLTQEYTYTVAGNARFTVNVNDLVTQSDVSTKVEADLPVICERSMYRYNKALGHDTIGTPSVARDWYLAEGTTAWGFDTYILVQNPNAEPALVDFEFMLPDGSIVPYGYLVPGQSRFTVHVDDLPGCESTDLSTHLSADLPVICERAMYWEGATLPGGHDTIGTPLPSTTWYLAEGTTDWGFEEYVLVQNPNDTQATVSFTFMKPDGDTVFFSVPVTANSRFSIKANDLVPESDISTQVVSDRPVICERAMYWKGRDGGHDTIGVRGE